MGRSNRKSAASSNQRKQPPSDEKLLECFYGLSSRSDAPPTIIAYGPFMLNRRNSREYYVALCIKNISGEPQFQAVAQWGYGRGNNKVMYSGDNLKAAVAAVNAVTEKKHEDGYSYRHWDKPTTLDLRTARKEVKKRAKHLVEEYGENPSWKKGDNPFK